MDALSFIILICCLGILTVLMITGWVIVTMNANPTKAQGENKPN